MSMLKESLVWALENWVC